MRLKRLLLLDNYDSFSYNLVQLFSLLPDVQVEVHRNDRIDIQEIVDKSPDAVIISPGPKSPKDSGICKEVIWKLKGRYPMFGVCLGMQIINEVFGGLTMLAPRPVHGEKDLIYHCGKGIFRGLTNPFQAARYHSLTVQVESEDIIITAQNSGGLVMGLQHAEYPIIGVQFHPESFMTPHGRKIAENFMELLGGD